MLTHGEALRGSGPPRNAGNAKNSRQAPSRYLPIQGQPAPKRAIVLARKWEDLVSIEIAGSRLPSTNSTGPCAGPSRIEAHYIRSVNEPSSHFSHPSQACP